MREDDEIPEVDDIAEPESDSASIIDGQLSLLLTVMEMDNADLYNDWIEQKIKVISTAMKIILRAQEALLSNFKESPPM